VKAGGGDSTIRATGRLLAVIALTAFPAPSHALDRDDLQNLLAEARSLQALIGRISRSRGTHGGSQSFIIYRDPIRSASRRYDIPAPLIAAVIRCESNWDPDARSSAGARGLMQVLPRTALATFGVRPSLLWDPMTNIHVGTAYLRMLATRYQGNASNVIAAYNAGPTRVDRGSRLPRETRRYRTCVRRWYAVYARSGR
jgi:soluble lytic murein transglycosylase-like protein